MAGINLPAALIAQETVVGTMVIMNNIDEQRIEEDTEMAAEEAAFEKEEKRRECEKKKGKTVRSEAKVYAATRVSAVEFAKMWNHNVRDRARTVATLLADKTLLDLADDIAVMGRDDKKPMKMPTTEELETSYIKAYTAFAKAAVAKVTDVGERVPTYPECEELVRKVRAEAKKKVEELHRQIALHQAELVRANARVVTLSKLLSRANSMDRFVRRALQSSEEESTRANELAQVQRAQTRLTAEIGALALQTTQIATAAAIEEREELRRCIERVEERLRRHAEQRRAASELAVAGMAALSVQQAVVREEASVEPSSDEDVDDKKPGEKSTTTNSQDDGDED